MAVYIALVYMFLKGSIALSGVIMYLCDNSIWLYNICSVVHLFGFTVQRLKAYKNTRSYSLLKICLKRTGFNRIMFAKDNAV